MSVIIGNLLVKGNKFIPNVFPSIDENNILGENVSRSDWAGSNLGPEYTAPEDCIIFGEFVCNVYSGSYNLQITINGVEIASFVASTCNQWVYLFLRKGDVFRTNASDPYSSYRVYGVKK